MTFFEHWWTRASRAGRIALFVASIAAMALGGAADHYWGQAPPRRRIMIGLLAPSVVAALVGMALGRSLAGCWSARIVWWPMLLAAFGVELVLYNPPINRLEAAMLAGPGIWIGCKVVMLVVLARNALAQDHRRVAWLVIFLGIALNTLAIAANGGHMPQSPAAAASAWGVDSVRADAYANRLENVTWMGPDSRLPELGDILALPSWFPRPTVLSIGDVVLAVGVGWWIFAGMSRGSLIAPKPRTRAVI